MCIRDRWYVEGGAVNFGYNSLVPYGGSWWKVTGGMVAVSYTHLDVYKRQAV